MARNGSRLSDAEVQAYVRRNTRGIYVFHPTDFLGLTVESPRVLSGIMAAPPSRSRPERDPPILIINPFHIETSFGSAHILEVTGHDGRHRAWAHYQAGLGFPVRILSKVPLNGMPTHFQGQFDKEHYLDLDPAFWYPPSQMG